MILKQCCSKAQHFNYSKLNVIIPELYLQQPIMVINLELFSPQPLTVNILKPLKQEESVKVNILELFTQKECEFINQHSRIFLLTFHHTCLATVAW